MLHSASAAVTAQQNQDKSLREFSSENNHVNFRVACYVSSDCRCKSRRIGMCLFFYDDDSFRHVASEQACMSHA